MRIFLLPVLGAALGAAAVTVAAPQSGDRDAPRPSMRERDEARITADLAALVPGKPVDCIDTRFQKPSLTAIGPRLIYRVSRDLIYVSETAGGCEGVARGDALVTRQFTTRLCRGEIAQTFDTTSRVPTGSCGIGPFTPYRPAGKN